MGGNIPGGNFLGGNFLGGSFPGGSLIGGIFRVGSFPGVIFLDPIQTIYFIFNLIRSIVDHDDNVDQMS